MGSSPFNALIAHVRFDEREVETGLWSGYLGTGDRKARQQTSLTPIITAPLLDSTALRALDVAPFVVRFWYISGLNHLAGSDDMDESRDGSRIVYPKLLATLTESDLISQFRLAPEERAWAGTAARRGPSMVVLATQLKVFQSIGHFLPLVQVPATALSYIAKQLSLTVPADVSIDPRTTYRQSSAIRTYLGVTPWGASARAVASKAVAVAAETRLDPAELVNAAIDALIRERCELPSLSTLLRLAGNAHRRINSSQWQQVHERLTALDVQRLDELLTPSADSQDSPFAVMSRGAGKATRDNLKELIAHYEWLRSLPDPAPMLTSISERDLIKSVRCVADEPNSSHYYWQNRVPTISIQN